MKLPTIKVEQPFGEFYLVSINSDKLLDITYSDFLKIRDYTEEGYTTEGAQRKIQINRSREIGKYIETTDAAFPNSIILAANYDEYGNSVLDEDLRWTILEENGQLFMDIPSNSRIASIIDGQHRLEGFRFANGYDKPFDCVCSVYLDLPAPLQSYLFATINFNQKAVSKSLAYELFGTGIKNQPPETWTPEKTAIFLTRKLNRTKDSPFFQHIIISAQQDELLISKIKEGWAVSTATIVDGIMKLFSKKPKDDRNNIHKVHIDKRNRGILLDDGSPLRSFFIENNDLFIYQVINNYFSAVKVSLFEQRQNNSYIVKTVGIQALFLFLKEVLEKELFVKKDISQVYYSTFFEKVKSVDFSDVFFQASGIGRSRILNILKLKCDFIELADLSNHVEEYREILEKYS